MKVMQELKKAFSPLMSDKSFGNMLIVISIFFVLLEMLVVSIMVHSYFYSPEQFANIMSIIKVNYLEHLIAVLLAGMSVWFGLNIKKRAEVNRRKEFKYDH